MDSSIKSLKNNERSDLSAARKERGELWHRLDRERATRIERHVTRTERRGTRNERVEL